MRQVGLMLMRWRSIRILRLAFLLGMELLCLLLYMFLLHHIGVPLWAVLLFNFLLVPILLWFLSRNEELPSSTLPLSGEGNGVQTLRSDPPL